MRWLHLKLYAPMASFGGQMIDAYGRTRDFPSLSMITGLFANSLGWTRSMAQAHQDLQSRLVFGALHEHHPDFSILTDYQTADLNKNDTAWTTHAEPATRGGGGKTYDGSHQRWRDYHIDLKMSLVVHLEEIEHEGKYPQPDLDHLADAINTPKRPLFIGRKSCLPSRPLYEGKLEANSAFEALQKVAHGLKEEETEKGLSFRALWPASSGAGQLNARQQLIADKRDWTSGVHAGTRYIHIGAIECAQREAL